MEELLEEALPAEGFAAARDALPAVAEEAFFPGAAFVDAALFAPVPEAFPLPAEAEDLPGGDFGAAGIRPAFAEEKVERSAKLPLWRVSPALI